MELPKGNPKKYKNYKFVDKPINYRTIEEYVSMNSSRYKTLKLESINIALMNCDEKDHEKKMILVCYKESNCRKDSTARKLKISNSKLKLKLDEWGVK